jgi:Apea-like HEPN
LFQKARAFLKQSLSLLSSKLDEAPREIEKKNVMSDDRSSFRIIYPSRFSVMHFILRYQKQIREFPKFKEYELLMQEDSNFSKHLGKNVGTMVGGARRDAWSFLSHILIKLLNSYQENNVFDERLFLKMYNDLETFVDSDAIPELIITPLLNFESEIRNIKIDDDISIRRISDMEKEKFLDNTEDLRLTRLDISQITYVIQYKIRIKKVFWDVREVNTDEAETLDLAKMLGTIITAMRLFKRGAIAFSLITMQPLLDLPMLAMSFQFGHSSLPIAYGEKYNLGSKEYRALQFFWKFINKVDYENSYPLSISIRRFNFAYERTNVEDKLIDYIISFENLFSKRSDSMDSVNHKLKLRFSRFLKKRSKDRKELFDDMGKYYTARSQIVHGSNKDNVMKDLPIERLEEYIRSSLKLYLGKKRDIPSHDAIINEIDFN